MNNFKKAALLLLLLFLFEKGLSFALEPVTFQHYLELELQRKDVENKQPDLVFIGNSRVSTCFIPSVFAGQMEDVDCAFNAGTGSQGIEGSYYYLMDILNQYDLKYVVFGLDYQTFFSEERVLKRDLVVLERLKSPVVKAAFIADVFQPSEYIYFLKSYQYRNEIGNAVSHVKQKLSKAYREGTYTEGKTVYEDLGFTREVTVFGEYAGIYSARPWLEEQIDRKKFSYLDKIIDLCREKNAKLYVVSTPLTISTVCTTQDYEACNLFFKTYLEERGVAYDNLNLMKDRGTLLPDATMNCMEHVGGDGAELVSDFYCRVLRSRIAGEDASAYFYESVADLRDHLSDVICCDLHTEKLDEAGNRNILATAVHRDGLTVEYRFELEREGTVTVLQEYSEQETCPLPAEKMAFPMLLRIRCRPAAGDGIEKVMTIRIEETTWE